jgi:hypothetical protein
MNMMYLYSMQLRALAATCYQQLDYSAPQSTLFPGCSSHQQHTGADASFDTLKEHLADVVDQIVSINNRQKVNIVIKSSTTRPSKRSV